MKKFCTPFILLFFQFYFTNAQNTIALQQFSAGYTSPLGIENCGDSRLFIVQQNGLIMISDANGNKRTEPFLDISDRTMHGGGEQGLLGLAFDPNYATNGYFYVNYINTNGNTQISRFKVNSAYPNKASAGSEKFILRITQPFTNHNGGCIRFGPDGYLYIGMGDGGSGGDPNNYAQNTQSLLGKMLRINVHAGNPYSIPADNPFINTTNYKKEIWDLGLRNPWRWCFDARTGALIIADVGQDAWEEVNYEQAGSGGKNYGWRCYEGDHAYNTSGCNAQSFYKFPVYEYSHSGTTGDCSITGGFVYRGNKYKSLKGKYFFADYCSGIIRTLVINNPNAVEQDVYTGDAYAYTSFGTDKNNELYVANIANGIIYQVIAASGLQNTDAVAVTNNFSVAPNPSHGNFIITYKSLKIQQAHIRIQNTLGQQFYAATKSLSTGANNINLSVHLPQGDYYIGITDASGKTIYQRIRIE